MTGFGRVQTLAQAANYARSSPLTDQTITEPQLPYRPGTGIHLASILGWVALSLNENFLLNWRQSRKDPCVSHNRSIVAFVHPDAPISAISPLPIYLPILTLEN